MAIQRINLQDFAAMVRKPLNESDVETSHQWRFKVSGATFDKDLGLTGKYCYHPFNTVTIDGNGECYMCICQAWVPVSVGNILDFNSLQEIAQSAKAREIQAAILDGSYKYCDNNTCHIIQNKEFSGSIEHRPDNINWINFAIDDSCNLSCPSCRQELIFHNKGPVFDKKMAISDHLVNLIQNHNSFLKFTLSGDGDPFASHVYRNILEKLQLKPDGQTEIEIVTNGILVKSHWDRMKGVHDSVVRFRISFDAGSPEVYAITRRGGDWDKLIENCRYIIDWKRQTGSSMQIEANFVVQTSNYQDIENFVQICQELGFDEINFQKVVDWGKWHNGTENHFEQHAVWMKEHPEHINLVAMLNRPSLTDRRINLNNLRHLRSTVSKLSDLINVRNKVSAQLQTNKIQTLLEKHSMLVEEILEIPGPHTLQSRSILNDTSEIIKQIETVQKSVDQVLIDINKEIDNITKNYHRRGYMINGYYATNRTSVEGERELRGMSMLEETKTKISAVIGKYADWQYPGLEIGPGDGQWTNKLVACEPLYLVDIHREFLDSASKNFNEKYRSKLRTYVTDETNLGMLPQEQFGFVFSWNVFNFLTSDLINQYLGEIYRVLRPGGVCMFSYNDADRVQGAINVEIGFMSYMPKHLLLSMIKQHGYEIITTGHLQETISWVEIHKPGELYTIKAQPTLGVVNQK